MKAQKFTKPDWARGIVQNNRFSPGWALKILCFVTVLLPLAAGRLNGQVIIWKENFSGGNQGWTEDFTDCNSNSPSFFGVQNDRYEVIDVAGAPCCPTPYPPGGGGINNWLTNPIDISNYCNVSISVDFGHMGNSLDCYGGGPYLGCSDNDGIEGAHDQIVFSYRIDGGPWIMFDYACGIFGVGPADTTGLQGNTIEILIQPSCKTNNNDGYWFDNVTVSGSPPVVTQPEDVTVCGGQPVGVSLFGTPGASYDWTNDNTATGLAASGSGSIGFISAGVATLQISTVSVIANLGAGCSGEPVTFAIIVNPVPIVVDPPNLTVCSDDQVNVTFNGSSVSADYNWTNTNPNIGLDDMGSGNLSFTAAIVGSNTSGTVTVIPTDNGCVGVPQNFSITVAPKPVANLPVNLSVCSGEPVSAVFNGTPGSTFSWTNDNPAIGLAASGTGSINFNSANVNSLQTATITATPKLGNCEGDPVVFTIKVAPLPMATPLPGPVEVCSGGLPVAINFTGTPGAAFNWTNTNPAIGLPVNGTGNINYSSPALGLHSETGTITVTPTVGGCTGPSVAFDLTIRITPAGNDTTDCPLLYCENLPLELSFMDVPNENYVYTWTNDNTATGIPAGGAGNLLFTSANVDSVETSFITVVATNNGCTGPPSWLYYSIAPVIEIPPANQMVCGGEQVTVHFTDADLPFVWTNDNPSIGLPASGTGNLNFTASAVAVNTTATITLDPTYGGSSCFPGYPGCMNAPVSFTITVAATPQADQPSDDSVCPGELVTVDFSGAATSFTWTNDNPAIGLPSSGSGNLNFTAATVVSQQIAHLSVIPSIGNCAGSPVSFEVLVNTTPTVNPVSDLSVCGGQPVSISLNGTGNPTFNWTNNNPNIGLTPVGAGNIMFSSANVSSTETGVIVVTPAMSACNGVADTFSISVVTAPTVVDPADLEVCGGSELAVDFIGSTGAVFSWTNTSPVIGLPASGTGSLDFVTAGLGIQEIATISVTPTFGACIGVTTDFTITVDPEVSAAITGMTTICSGETITLSASGASIYSWDGGETSADIDVSPAATSSFTVTVSNAAGCADTVGVTVTVLPTYTSVYQNSSCNPADTGILVVALQSLAGCDSTVTRITGLLPASMTGLSAMTCDPTQAGVFMQNLVNQFGCDSVVTTTITYDPSNVDTTLLSLATCDPNQAGTSQLLYNGSNGCDSLVITTSVLSPSQAINLSAVTCDPVQAGVFVQNLINQFGCDSIVTTTITFDPSNVDTTLLTQMTCDPSLAGTSQSVFNGSNGCDSLVLTTTLLRAPDTTNVSLLTCHTAEAGVFVQMFSNQSGCDSVVVTTISFDPASLDLSYAFATTCDPASAGTLQTVFTGSDGCDSLVITTILLVPKDTSYVFQNTCDPDQAGIFADLWSNQYGCDSLVFRIIELLPADTTLFTFKTCDAGQAGTSIETLTGLDGCDSVLVTQTLFEPALCSVVAALNVENLSCAGADDGVALLVASAGTPPFNFTWTDGAGNTGSGQVAGLFDSLMVAGLAPGLFSITITGANGPPGIVLTAQVSTPAPLLVQANPGPDHQSFSVSCFGGSDGLAQASVQGGTPPYQFLWQNGATTGIVSGLAAGLYTLTVTDVQGCSVAGAVELSEPTALQLSAEVGPLSCGDSLAEVSIMGSGGAGSRVLSIDQQPVSGLTVSLQAGSHFLQLTDANGCTTDTILDLNIPPVPQLFLPGDTIIQLGQVLTVTAATNVEVWQSLVWEPLPNTGCAGCLQQSWTPQSNEQYTLTLVDTFGCRVSVSLRVTVQKTVDLYAPNIFSPNNDLLHDVWQIDAGPAVSLLETLFIFDRWGDQVYTLDAAVSPDAWPGWNGKVGGRPVMPGVYVYYLRVRLVNGEIFEKKGSITIAGK